MLAWLGFGFMLAAVPYYLVMVLQKELSEEASESLSAEDRETNSYRNMTYGFVLALTSWAGAYHIMIVVDRLVNFFDRSPISLNTDSTSGKALIVDLINHSLITIMYYFESMVITGGGYAYVYYSLRPDELMDD